MPIINTKDLTAEAIKGLSFMDRHHIYNGLDCCITAEVFDALSEQLRQENEPYHKLIYDFERGMQAPALEMMIRGFKVDEYERRLMVEKLKKTKDRVQLALGRFAMAVWGKPVNDKFANSSSQLQKFFYFDPDGMKLPPIELSFKGVRRVTCNREALEKLADRYIHAVPIINCILALRDITKKLSVLETDISEDSRYRTSYGVSSTTSGRWNSTADAFGEGGNLQNITVELRKIFVADPGKKLGHLDLEQADSRAVGMLVWATVGDETYLLACESGDLHTYVAKLLWPGLVVDKRTAEAIFYRHYSYRDMSKRGGHASNYLVTPYTMARHLKIAQALAESFQVSYFGAFPGIKKWQTWTSQKLSLDAQLVTFLGRERTFFGRPDSDTTLREAVAHIPQSNTTEVLNLILYRLWKSRFPIELVGKVNGFHDRWPGGSPTECLTQEHDGFTFQYPDDRVLEKEIFHALKEAAVVEIPVTSITGETRNFVIPYDMSCGWNWAPSDKPPFLNLETKQTSNPNGLAKWRGQDDRRRIEGLDRIIR